MATVIHAEDSSNNYKSQHYFDSLNAHKRRALPDLTKMMSSIPMTKPSLLGRNTLEQHERIHNRQSNASVVHKSK